VFMGMGEPMANYRSTRDGIARLLDPEGMTLGARHVTVSTVGVVPGIRRLAFDHPQVGLAVSLHAADDELRTELVPVNRWWPLAELEEAITGWREATRRRPSIEWTMMRDVNDDDRQARLLAPIARRLRAHVNLIPMNPVARSAFQPSTSERIQGFVHTLRSPGDPGHRPGHPWPRNRCRLRPTPMGVRPGLSPGCFRPGIAELERRTRRCRWPSPAPPPSSGWSGWPAGSDRRAGPLPDRA
jgi:hypothetical protein